jgi:hypothetical protein
LRHMSSYAKKLLCVSILLGWSSATRAQSTIAPRVAVPDNPEYVNRGVQLGSIKFVPSVEFATEYNDNVYAAPSDGDHDISFIASPQFRATTSSANIDFNAIGRMTVTRFASLKTENSIAATTSANVVWRAREGVSLAAEAGYNRLVEDRGDVERLRNPASGPRLTDMVSAGIKFRHERGRLRYDMTGLVQKYDALAARDDDRDFTTYSVSAKAGARITGATFITATAFVSKRDFRILDTAGAFSRNSTTYGARAGLDFTSNAFIDGHIGVGVFRFNATSDQIEDHTGVSIDANITYRPRRRTAIVFNAFQGDVATFRLGAAARTDTQVGLTLQQEVRHNLFGSLGVSWLKNEYRTRVNALRTAQAQGKMELLVSRRFSTIASVTYAKRTSDNPIEPFERFRTNLALRFAL